MPRRLMTRTETREERKGKRKKTSKQHTSNSSNLVEEATPQIRFLDAKPFVIFMDALFQVDGYLKQKKGLVVYFLCSGMKIEFLFSTGIKQQSSALFWTYRNS